MNTCKHVHVLYMYIVTESLARAVDGRHHAVMTNDVI